MILSNDGLVAFHYRSYGTFFLHKNRLHKIHRGFTHYKYYRAFFCVFNYQIFFLWQLWSSDELLLSGAKQNGSLFLFSNLGRFWFNVIKVTEYKSIV